MARRVYRLASAGGSAHSSVMNISARVWGGVSLALLLMGLSGCGAVPSSSRVANPIVGAWIVKDPNAPFPFHMYVFNGDGTMQQANPDAAIVERVEGLMATCRALEAEIEHARTHATHLLQAVLKEAFAPAA